MCKASHILLITEGSAGSNTQLRIDTSEKIQITISKDGKIATITAPTPFKGPRGDTEIMSGDGECTPTTTEEKANDQRVPTDPAIEYAVREILYTRD